MKLIREEINDAQYIVEEKEGKKNYSIKGVFSTIRHQKS